MCDDMLGRVILVVDVPFHQQACIESLFLRHAFGANGVPDDCVTCAVTEISASVSE